MNLQEKYNNYKTPLDEEAWSQFQELRKNKEDNKKGYWETQVSKENKNKKNRWWLLYFLLMVGMGTYLYTSYQNVSSKELGVQEPPINKEWSSDISNKSKEANQGITYEGKEKINGISTSSVTTNTPVNTKETTTSIKNNNKKNSPSSISEANLKNKKLSELKLRHLQQRSDSGSLISDNQLKIEETTELELTNYPPTNAEQSFSTTIKENNSLPNASSSDQSLTNKVKPTQIIAPQSNRELIDIPSIETMSILLTTETKKISVDSSLMLPTPITKTSRQSSKKNHFKLTTAYADYYVNGIILTENQVDKKGGLFQVEYSRNLNAILGIGASIGYSKGEDQNNPQLDTLDFERIHYAHLNLYLYLLNTPNYRLNLKVGSGITQTKRVHSFFIIRPNIPPQRGLQINTLTDFGFLVEGSFERRIRKDLWLGITYGEISHNDGAWYGGVSLGYNF